MGFKFRKSIKIAPGIKLNFNKKSTGITFGGKGLHYTINSKGKRTKSVGIPGTGLYYSTSSSSSKSTRKKTTSTNAENFVNKENENMSNKKWYQKNWGIILLLFLFFPVGLYLMWKHANWNKGVKIAVTVIILLCCFFPSSDETQPITDVDTSTTVATTEEATTEEATTEGVTTEEPTTEEITTTEATTKETTIKETTTKETTTKKVTTTAAEEYYYEEEEEESEMVWIPNSGSKYHSYSGCSNMKNPSEVTIDTAISRGYSACSKCW